MPVSFPLRLRDVNVYCNDERSRTFIALTLAPDDRAPVQRIVSDLDDVLREFRLAPFYEEGSFHVSILWCLGDQHKRLLNVHAELVQLLVQHIAASIGKDADDDDDQDVVSDDAFSLNSVDRIDCKTGNKLYTFSLT